jgi:hypothetical protein
MSLDATKVTVDGLSIVVILGTLAQALPAIAAAASLIWTVIRIYETKTIQRAIARWRGRPVQDPTDG